MSPSKTSLPLYRYYRLDAAGRIRGAEIVEAADDAMAVAGARTLHRRFGDPGFELWVRARRVPADVEPAPVSV